MFRAFLALGCLVASGFASAGFEPEFWEFIPLHKGQLFPNGSSSAWSCPCFLQNSAVLKVGDGSATAAVTSGQRNGSSCSDLYLFVTNQNFHVHRIDSVGQQEVTFKWRNEEEQVYVAEYGLQIFLIQDGVLGFLDDLLLTLELFVGPKTAAEQKLFLEEFLGYDFVPRSNSVVLNESDVLSGDYLAILKMGGAPGGSDDLICYGTGSRIGHVASTLWIGGQLYIVESTGDGSPSGVIKTPWSEWLKRWGATQTLVALLRLNETLRAKFDVDKAIDYFQSVEGLPYGYHNFFFGWIDTASDNYPPPLSPQLVPLVLELLDRVDHSEADRLAGQALNKRLNTSGLHMYDLFIEMERRNVSFNDVMSWPEQDSWVYSDGRSLVCDVFVLQMYRAAGLFDSIDFQATELTPMDSYLLDIFEHDDSWRPSQCVSSDPDLPYCQILGGFKLTLPNWNTIVPYDDMFQSCGGLPPFYNRTAGC